MNQPSNSGQNPNQGKPVPGSQPPRPAQPQPPSQPPGEQRVRTRVVPAPGQQPRTPQPPQQGQPAIPVQVPPAPMPPADPFAFPDPGQQAIPPSWAQPAQPQQHPQHSQQPYPYSYPNAPPNYAHPGAHPGYPQQQPGMQWQQGMAAPNAGVRRGGVFSLARGGMIAMVCGLIVIAMALLAIMISTAAVEGDGASAILIGVGTLGGLGLAALIVGECLCMSVPKAAGKMNVVGAVVMQGVAIAAALITWLVVDAEGGSTSVSTSGGGSVEAMLDRGLAVLPWIFAAVPAAVSFFLLSGFSRETNKFVGHQANTKMGTWIVIATGILVALAVILFALGVVPEAGGAGFWVLRILGTLTQVAAIGLISFYLIVTQRAVAGM